MTTDLTLAYEAALTATVEGLNANHSVLSILVGGSYVRNELQSDSDLDIILLKRDVEDIVVENGEVDDIKVETFALTEKIALEKFDAERKTNHRFVAGVLSGCSFVVGDEELASKVIQAARDTFEAKVPDYSLNERYKLIQFLQSMKGEGERLKKADQSVALALRMNQVTYMCFENALHFEGKLVPPLKKVDDYLSQLENREVADGIIAALQEVDMERRFEAWQNLIHSIISRLR